MFDFFSLKDWVLFPEPNDVSYWYNITKKKIQDSWQPYLKSDFKTWHHTSFLLREPSKFIWFCIKTDFWGRFCFIFYSIALFAYLLISASQYGGSLVTKCQLWIWRKLTRKSWQMLGLRIRRIKQFFSSGYSWNNPCKLQIY